MKQKLNICLTSVLLGLLVFVSCSPESEAPDDKTNVKITYQVEEWIDSDSVRIEPTRGDVDAKSVKRRLKTSCDSVAVDVSTSSTFPNSSHSGSITRGAGSSVSAIISNGFGVSAAIYPTDGSYTSAGCGSYFYEIHAVPGVPMDYYWPTSDKKMAFYAYYPYGDSNYHLSSLASSTGIPSYSVSVPSAIASQKDFMTCQVLDHIPGSQNSLGLTFNHRMSALRFFFTNERSESVTVKSVSVEGVYYNGTLTGTSWTSTGSVNTSSTNPFKLILNQSVAAGASEIDLTHTSNIFFMLPQTLPVGAKIVVEIDDDTYEVNLDGSWIAGMTYTYGMTLNAKLTGIVAFASSSVEKTVGDGDFTISPSVTGNGAVTYASSNTSVATVNSSTGRVHLVGPYGTANITATMTETSSYTGATDTYQLTVYPNFPVNQVRNFSYTASVQSADLRPGRYKLQCWGAQGGSSGAGYSGGKGGYSEGILTVNNSMTIYAFVGGQGSTSGNGGWNGGGGSSGYSEYTSGNTYGYSYMGCGGGATDFALETSSMSYSSRRTNRSDASLKSRMIVAGGGSGGAYTYREEETSITVHKTETGSSWGQQSVADGEAGWIEIVTAPSEAGRVFTIERPGTGLFAHSTGDIGWSFHNGNPFDSGADMFDVYENHLTIKAAPSGYQYASLIIYTGSINSLRTAYENGDISYLPNTANTGIYKQFDFSYTISWDENETTQDTSSDYTSGNYGGGTSGGGSYPGTQSSAGSGGSFGQGANQTISNYRHCSGAGGGGWYGGGGGTYSDSSMSYIYKMGGGSGFVNTAANASYRPSGYTGLQLDSGTTYAGNTTFTRTSGGSETGHSGNGYARITRIE